MSPILDQLAAAEIRCRPRSISEFFAFQLTRKLDSWDRLGPYVMLVERHRRADILLALARARKHLAGARLSDRFEQELNKLAERDE